MGRLGGTAGGCRVCFMFNTIESGSFKEPRKSFGAKQKRLALSNSP